MLARKAKGQLFENEARLFLEKKGLNFRDNNAHAKGGEIDLVMQDNNCIVFVEVRFRKKATYGNAAETVTYSKRQRMLRAAMFWLMRNGYPSESTEFRFDIVSFDGSADNVHWLPAISIEG
ncbi:YraN family protein [Parasalinivibrio latis]|uniref:YraN family protein n=1 Tax=Parasalinivibrio latis TaxID=2952610 RepID=UPI0030DFF8E7